MLARLTERLQQAETKLLPRHLHEAQRRHLRDLVLRSVAREALDETAQHEVTVGLQHHIDEVDDDNSADVAQSQLAHDFFGGLQVVLGDRLFEVSARPDELAGVDVNNRHGLGAVNDERTAGRQPHLAVERLLDLLADAVGVERVAGLVVGLHTIEQVGSDRAQVVLDRRLRILAGDDQLLEVLVEHVANDLDEQVGLGMQKHRCLLGLDKPADLCPLAGQAIDVKGQLLLGGALRGSSHDDANVLGQHLLEDGLQPGSLGIRKFAADAVHRSVRNVDQVTAGQAYLAR